MLLEGNSELVYKAAMFYNVGYFKGGFDGPTNTTRTAAYVAVAIMTS